MSLSLIAVFIPILLMGGIVGRLFREFAVTLSVAILISLAISLTTTPMMCARLLRAKAARAPGRIAAASAAGVGRARRRLPEEPRVRARARRRRHARPRRDGCLNVYLYVIDSEGLLPAAGHGPAHRRDPGRPEHLVPGDAREARRLHDHRPRRPGGRERRRLHRRRPAQLGHHVRRAEAAVRAQRDRRPGDRAAARASSRRCPARACSCSPCRTSGSAAGRPTRSTSSRCRPTTSPSSAPGSRGSGGALATCRSSPTSTPISRTRACRPRSSSTATPRRASA